MAANTRLATSIQILCVIAYKGRGGTTSEVVAKSLRTNPVVVLRLLKSLEQHGLVEMRPGKDGGVQLRQNPDQIFLNQIHSAVEVKTTVFALRAAGDPECPVDSNIRGLLTPIFENVSDAVEKSLGQTTLADLMNKVL